MSLLEAREAYRLWAPVYGENALTCLEESVAQSLSPSPVGGRLLDAGCGTGLRLKDCDAGFSVGVDTSPDMLMAGGVTRAAAADVRALPFPDGAFDLVWCRLVLGYLPDAAPAYRELARVCRPGGYLLVTDMHPGTVGQKRTFRDAMGALHEIRSYAHEIGAQEMMADAAGFELASRRDGVIGPVIRDFYIWAGRIADYEKSLGMPLVAGLLFRRTE